MAVSKITNALVAGVNENTLALANLSLDFSMIKVEVPADYQGLGSSLTRKRRETAEDGSAHQTARRLGILFQDLIPSTPELLRAYGRRATEICSSSPGLDQAATGQGIFSSFVGPDVTSVWAAATSGAASIAVHLLACLLARLWKGPQATSIWVEIVEERRRIVAEQAQEGLHNTSIELQLVARQQISRQDLAQWDSSARAWLQVADDAQVHRQKQLWLIINNINLPINTGSSTYQRVLDAWVTALTVMERLLNGQPQRAAKGAPLMGLVCWHLYPDLLILGETSLPVVFNDELIPLGAQLTVGVERVGLDGDHGIHWSLPLSHLRFYGDPVVANTSTTKDSSRLGIEDMHLLALGATLSHWGNLAYDPCLGARFFIALASCVPTIESDPSLRSLQILCGASKRLMASTGDARETYLAIVALGRRNGRRFLAEPGEYPPPLLGLGHRYLLKRLRESHSGFHYMDNVEVLRYIASELHLECGECLIRQPSAESAFGTTYLYRGRSVSD